jgi:hypothetical protein
MTLQVSQRISFTRNALQHLKQQGRLVAQVHTQRVRAHGAHVAGSEGGDEANRADQEQTGGTFETECDGSS